MFLCIIKKYLDNSHIAWKQKDTLKILKKLVKPFCYLKAKDLSK